LADMLAPMALWYKRLSANGRTGLRAANHRIRACTKRTPDNPEPAGTFQRSSKLHHKYLAISSESIRLMPLQLPKITKDFLSLKNFDCGLERYQRHPWSQGFLHPHRTGPLYNVAPSSPPKLITESHERH